MTREFTPPRQPLTPPGFSKPRAVRAWGGGFLVFCGTGAVYFFDPEQDEWVRRPSVPGSYAAAYEDQEARKAVRAAAHAHWQRRERAVADRTAAETAEGRANVERRYPLLSRMIDNQSYQVMAQRVTARAEHLRGHDRQSVMQIVDGARRYAERWWRARAGCWSEHVYLPPENVRELDQRMRELAKCVDRIQVRLADAVKRRGMTFTVPTRDEILSEIRRPGYLEEEARLRDELALDSPTLVSASRVA